MSNTTSATIEIYSKTHCPYCVKAKLLLDQLGATYQEYNIETEATRFAELRERRPSARTVPQIFIDGHGVGGCDDLYALHEQGELLPLLRL